MRNAIFGGIFALFPPIFAFLRSFFPFFFGRFDFFLIFATGIYNLWLMKKVFIVLMMALMSSMVMAQDEVLSYSEVIQVEGASAMDLYKNARNWMARTYGSSKEVIEYDQAGEEITGNGLIPFTVGNITWAFISGRIRYVVNMKFRDGRYKVTVDHFRHESTDARFPETKSAYLLYRASSEKEIDSWTKGAFEKKSFRKLYKEVYKRALPLCEAEAKKIIEGVKSSSIQKVEDDW